MPRRASAAARRLAGLAVATAISELLSDTGTTRWAAASRPCRRYSASPPVGQAPVSPRPRAGRIVHGANREPHGPLGLGIRHQKQSANHQYLVEPCRALVDHPPVLWLVAQEVDQFTLST